jgi:very-short-patch-repair endonuclease
MPPSARVAQVHPAEALERLGGSADRRALLQLTSRRRLDAAVTGRDVLRAGRGRYVLPTADEGLRAAASLAGVASHGSAAAIYGWKLARRPPRPDVTVPRNRNVDARRRLGVTLRYRDLAPAEVLDLVTEQHRTVIDCAKDLPFTEALAVADSALRSRQVDHDRLSWLAEQVPTTGRTQTLRVVGAASPLAANPFESVLRALALEAGLDVVPQRWIEERGLRVRPDLVDRSRRLVLEADSFAWHGRRDALKRDCERYDGLVIRGWRVLRFAWEHVILEPDYVLAMLGAAAGGLPEREALSPVLLYSA